MMWYYAFAAVVILHKYMYTVSASLQYAHSFFKMTIWGAFNSNYCVTHSILENCPKKLYRLAHFHNVLTYVIPSFTKKGLLHV